MNPKTFPAPPAMFAIPSALSLAAVVLLGGCEVTVRVGGRGQPSGADGGPGVGGAADGGLVGAPDVRRNPGESDGGLGGSDGGLGGSDGGLGGSDGGLGGSDGGLGGSDGRLGGTDGGLGGTGGGLSDGGGSDVSLPSTDGSVDLRTDGPVPVHDPLTAASKLDLLFLIDDSNSMAPLQTKLRARMPEFMTVLQNAPGGMPDLHVAVVSSSLGAGIFGNVTGCTPGSPGNLEGTFQHKAGCGLRAGETYLKTSGGANPVNNFDGDIAGVFSCLADLGQNGCGFENQLGAVQLALQKTTVMGGENYGFLRDGALLAIVFLTNEDDCSVDASSLLFDPRQQSVMDTLGGLQSYRCNEFGHLCDQELPHDAPLSPVTMTNCRSREDGVLLRTRDFIDFLHTLKPGRPQDLFLAVIGGPTAPYTVKGQSFMLASGGIEQQPQVVHSCTAGSSANEYADPAIRLNQVAQAFAPNSTFASICADDFSATVTSIAQQMVGR